MSDDRENRIRTHAYELWEQEGRPEGRHADHWKTASDALSDAPQADPAPDDTDPLPPAADTGAKLAPLAPPTIDAEPVEPAVTADTAPVKTSRPPARKARGRKSPA